MPSGDRQSLIVHFNGMQWVEIKVPEKGELFSAGENHLMIFGLVEIMGHYFNITVFIEMWKSRLIRVTLILMRH
jgi:hypothetical protein